MVSPSAKAGKAEPHQIQKGGFYGPPFLIVTLVWLSFDAKHVMYDLT